MRELTYYVAVTIDGFIAGPDHQVDAFLYEGDHSAVLFEEFGDALPAHVHAAFGTEPPHTKFDTVIMGWNTYTPALDVGITSPYSHLRQVIATRQPRDVAGEVELTPDPVARVRELKHDDGLGIYLAGGGDLAGQLIDEIDRLVLKRNPFVYGNGIPLFGRAPYRPIRFDHERSRTFESGVVISEYVRPVE